MARVAAIDLGTNTFLCLIAEISPARLKVVEDLSEVVRLGEKVNQNGYFLDSALNRAELCLQEFSQAIHKYQVDHVVATATSAARDASNGQALLDLGKKYRIPITIIEGQREAELSFEGAISKIQECEKKNIFVIDVGGGSTELIYRESGGKSIQAKSYDIGAVRLTEIFVKSDPISQHELAQIVRHASQTFEPYGRIQADSVIAVAGTPTTLACIAQEIDFDESKVEGYSLSRGEINRLVSRLASMKLESRKHVKGLEPLRADVIVTGALILLRALELSNQEKLVVSTRGLRYGLAIHYKEFL